MLPLPTVTRMHMSMVDMHMAMVVLWVAFIEIQEYTYDRTNVKRVNHNLDQALFCSCLRKRS